MKAVLLSTRPKWCEKICHEIGKNENGKPIYEKTIEVRKTKPSYLRRFKVYIYCTKDKRDAFNNHNANLFLSPKGWQTHSECNGKVIGEFVCDKVEEISCLSFVEKGYEIDTCLTYKEFYEYGKGKPLYGWHISELKIYDKPKELNEIVRPCSYKGICYSCDRFMPNGSGDRNFRFCNTKITRPPESWCYVQELEERK